MGPLWPRQQRVLRVQTLSGIYPKEKDRSTIVQLDLQLSLAIHFLLSHSGLMQGELPSGCLLAWKSEPMV